MGEPTDARWYSKFLPWHRRASSSSRQLRTKPQRRKIVARLPSRYLVDVDPAVSVTQTYGKLALLSIIISILLYL